MEKKVKHRLQLHVTGYASIWANRKHNDTRQTAAEEKNAKLNGKNATRCECERRHSRLFLRIHFVGWERCSKNCGWISCSDRRPRLFHIILPLVLTRNSFFSHFILTFDLSGEFETRARQIWNDGDTESVNAMHGNHFNSTNLKKIILIFGREWLWFVRLLRLKANIQLMMLLTADDGKTFAYRSRAQAKLISFARMQRSSNCSPKR